jgi:hypothetical protein
MSHILKKNETVVNTFRRNIAYVCAGTKFKFCGSLLRENPKYVTDIDVFVFGNLNLSTIQRVRKRAKEKHINPFLYRFQANKKKSSTFIDTEIQEPDVVSKVLENYTSLNIDAYQEIEQCYVFYSFTFVPEQIDRQAVPQTQRLDANIMFDGSMDKLYWVLYNFYKEQGLFSKLSQLQQEHGEIAIVQTWIDFLRQMSKHPKLADLYDEFEKYFYKVTKELYGIGKVGELVFATESKIHDKVNKQLRQKHGPVLDAIKDMYE